MTNPEVAKKAAQMMTKFKREMRKVTGKPLFELDKSEAMESAKQAIKRNIELLFKKKTVENSIEVSVAEDPEVEGRAVITLTAKDEFGEYILNKYMQMQKEME
jgi:predicted secreted protein